MRVAGTQTNITRKSANARLAMNKFVTVRIRGTRNTTAITKLCNLEKRKKDNENQGLLFTFI